MKKLALLLIGLMSSGMASAIQYTDTGPFQMNQCALLNEDVTVTLTNGVEAGIDCNTTTNIIALAACHTAGRTATRSQDVTTCETVNGTESCTTTVDVVEGAAIPVASTRRGTVMTQYPGAACTAGAAEGLATSEAAVQ